MSPREPRPGPALDFSSWTERVTDELRAVERHAVVRDVAAVKRGRRVVVWRHRDREATVTDEGAVRWVTFSGGATMMPPLAVERHDAFTARNVARTLAGFFDASLSRART